MNIFFGIDFGTTNTVISIAGKSDNIIDSFSVPTILFIPKDKGINKVYIGKEAVTKYISDKDGRYIHSIKRSLLDTHFKSTKINNVKVTLEDLIALFLNELKNRIYDQWGIIPEKIALGKPVKFSEIIEENQLANKRLLEGFKLAGFKDIVQLEEPIAAVYGIDSANNIEQNRILIVDIGGGTTDFTAVNIDNSKEKISKFKVTKIDGIDIGGDNFDEEMMFRHLTPFFGLKDTYNSYNKNLELPIHLFTDICKWNQIYRFDNVKFSEEFKDYLYGSSNPAAVKMLSNIYTQRLSSRILDEVKETKHILTEKKSSIIDLNSINLKVNTTISKDSLDIIFQKYMDKIIKVHNGMFLDGKNSFNKIVVTGGSSKLPQIRTAIKENSKHIQIEFDNNYYSSIANGLALYCKYKS